MPELETTPILPVTPPRRSFPLWPLLLGSLFVFLLAGGLGGFYYLTKLKSEINSSPSPSPIVSPTPSVSATPSASPKSSPKPSLKPSLKPTSKPSPLPTIPSFTPINLDLRFGNPSANIKQTFDDGSGTGRVINREYSSIQTGQFDELPSSWSPRVTVCYHLIANEKLDGALINYTFSLDNVTEVQDNFSSIGIMEAGRIYDWCHDVTTALGAHTAKLVLNPTRSLKEGNYANDLARVDWTNLADNIPPNFTLMGPVYEGTTGVCLFPQYISDNVTLVSALKIEQKVDSADWTAFTGTRYCFANEHNTTHTYSVKITDARGNKTEQTRTFTITLPD